MINQSENDEAFLQAMKMILKKRRIRENNNLKEFLLKNAPVNFNRIWKNINKED